MNQHDVTVFTPGETIGSIDQETGDGVIIKILAIEEETSQIMVQVTDSNDHWSSCGLPVDFRALMRPGNLPQRWIFNAPALPWFILNAETNEMKRFLHYR